MGILVFAVMMVISLIHYFWAFGGVWPAKSKAELYAMVIGQPDQSLKMPAPPVTFIVATLILLAGLFALPSFDRAMGMISALALPIITLVFLGRGFATYLMKRREARLLEPFRKLNYRYYSPLCIALGLSYLAITVAYFAN